MLHPKSQSCEPILIKNGFIDRSVLLIGFSDFLFPRDEMSSMVLEKKQLLLRKEQAQECRQVGGHAHQVAHVKRVFESLRDFLSQTILATLLAKVPDSKEASAIGG